VSDAEKRRLEEGRLNSTMSRLRKKVEPNPSHPKYIIAVRGEGYRLELEG
jgi:DNA-binding response OmpR family regulator